MESNQFTYVETPNPHVARGREILKKYPELKKLMKPYPLSFGYITLMNGIQLSLAYGLRNEAWWVVVLVAYLFGALVAHGLFALLHDGSHNLIFKSNTANKLAIIFSNVGQGFPSAIGFQTFHLLHHSYQGRYELDADLSFKTEAKLVGNSTLKKFIWYFVFLFVEAIRPAHVKVKLFSGWLVLNAVFIFGLDLLIYLYWGPKALAYIFLSTFFGVGLHPVGARWVQEHFVFKEGQETYSYYGPLNKVQFNIGLHNEHHDVHTIPWVHLPKVRKTAAEYYDSLYAHHSWTKLLLRFLFDPKVSLYSRYLRAK